MDGAKFAVARRRETYADLVRGEDPRPAFARLPSGAPKAPKAAKAKAAPAKPAKAKAEKPKAAKPKAAKVRGVRR